MLPRRNARNRAALRGYADGPLRVRRPEEIAYGIGRCALGRVLVAMGDSGLVSIIVRDRERPLVEELRARLPKAVLRRDESACRPIVARVARYIEAPAGRFPLRLELRGTDFQKRVWREVQKIPCGATTTYAKVAEAIGAPKAIRAVGSSCTRCWFAFAVPCHRVLGSGTAATDAASRRRLRWVAYERGICATARR